MQHPATFLKGAGMKSSFLFVGLLLYSSLGFTHMYIECGKNVDVDNGTVEGFHFALSTEESTDSFAGPVGGSWELKLTQEFAKSMGLALQEPRADANLGWVKPTQKVTAKDLSTEESDVVEITLVREQSTTGEAGRMYRVLDLYSDEPTAEEFTFGGIAGYVKTGSFKCYSSND